MLVSAVSGGIHLQAVWYLNSASAPVSTQKLVGHQLVFGFTLTVFGGHMKAGHLRGGDYMPG